MSEIRDGYWEVEGFYLQGKVDGVDVWAKWEPDRYQVLCSALCWDALKDRFYELLGPKGFPLRTGSCITYLRLSSTYQPEISGHGLTTGRDGIARVMARWLVSDQQPGSVTTDCPNVSRRWVRRPRSAPGRDGRSGLHGAGGQS